MKKYISYIGICLAILLSGCNQEDDVFEIFASGQTWHWIGSYDTNNWEDDNKSTSSLTRSELAQITQDKEKYVVRFSKDGTVEGQGNAFTFTGTWSANGKDRSFSIRINANGTPSGLDKTFFDEISNAKFYRGRLKEFHQTFRHGQKTFHPVLPGGFIQELIRYIWKQTITNKKY